MIQIDWDSLKLCPKCGSNAVDVDSEDRVCKNYYIHCLLCGHSSELCTGKADEANQEVADRAVYSWNSQLKAPGLLEPENSPDYDLKTLISLSIAKQGVLHGVQDLQWLDLDPILEIINKNINKKVYLIDQFDRYCPENNNGEFIRAAFSSEEKAQKYIDKKDPKSKNGKRESSNGLSIREFDLDKTK